MAECVFCMIGRGQMTARVVYEDDRFIAFDDIAPQAPVHTLVIPKAHFEHLGDGMPTELIGSLFALVPLIAHMKHVDASGYRVIVNTGRDASQTVHHVHLHILGGAAMTHGMVHLGERAE